ncbi:hypothetical protein AX17_001590 [Amanita inopinata Kibby_2008]|nr:hypothetical protein AX17_001590 [Amanita inopinata Kibby_2008]
MRCIRRTHLRRFYSSTTTTTTTTARPPLTVGMRREDPQRIWERRAPLTPDDVHYLVSERGVDVHVEPCERRVFPTSEYAKAGAKIEPSLRNAHIIVGIKETPLDELVTSPVQTPRTSDSGQTWSSRTHMMFSHTAKGQPYNTPLLSRFLTSSESSSSSSQLLPRLIDYELLTDESDGKRTVGFGWFAGVAGVLESLSAMAHAHLEIGVASPFLYTPRPHNLPSLDQLRAALREIGNRIVQEGTPRTLGPFVIGLTGSGNVAQGCLSMLSELPIHVVGVKDLDALVRDPNTDLHKIYLVHPKPEDYFVRSDGKKYDRASYYASPELYHSVFCDKIAPYLTLFLNGIGWSSGYPRLMSNEQLVTALERAQELGGARCTNIGDITCDVEGGLEFMTVATTLSSPSFKVRPQTKSGCPSLPDVQVMSVDILPTSIPLDASRHFSNAMLPYLERVMGWYTGRESAGKDDLLGRALERATIAVNGSLIEKHQWLQEGVDKWRVTSGAAKVADASTPTPSSSTSAESSGAVKKKRMLLLGSGMVAGPAVDHIAQRKDVELVVASNMQGELELLAKKHDNVSYKALDMGDEAGLASLVAQSDVVISLLPVALHTRAAEHCIQHGKHLVTASYISPSMRDLHTRAIQSNTLLLNEIGLDPGIDHCSTYALLSQFKRQHKRVVSFTSFCGGLPAPESIADNSGGGGGGGGGGIVPLSYKFSWSPRGVLSAALNGARFKLAGVTREIGGSDLLRTYFPSVPVLPGQQGQQQQKVTFEGLANRDSLPYVDTYGLGKLEELRTVLRGTLRYPGFARLMWGFKQLGLLEMEKKVSVGGEWERLIPAALAKAMGDEGVERMRADEAIRKALGARYEELAEEVVRAGRWLGIVGDDGEKGRVKRPMPRVPAGQVAPLDLFAALLGDRLRYEPGERDMVVLSHEFVVKSESGRGQQNLPVEEVYKSSLVAYGDAREGGYTAMARTVGIPIAIAALTVLDGKVGPKQGVVGVVGPSEPNVYEAVLEGLERVGLGMTEVKIAGNVQTVEQALVDGFRP